MAGVVEAASALAPLREELHCLPGPQGFDGAPTWTLHDPANNRFFRIGWQEFEILARWAVGQTEAIAQAVNRETTLHIDADQVGEFAQFLLNHNLLRLSGDAGLQRLRQQVAMRKQSWAQWLLHNYLFFKIPLLKPDALLAWLYPRLAWIYSGQFAVLLMGCALLAGFLLSRQWERFLATFPHFFNWSGLAQYFLALMLAKTLHEFGHALTAHRYGCRVPTMGVAFMVMYPMLYTDASETWKLSSRRQRVAIAGAGIAAELGLAVFAALAWNFLADGPLRSGVFLLATSTWIMTLAINLSPFMRFDGYYLLGDWLGIENLQPRAFAYNRWHLRRLLFGLEQAPPESLPKRWQWFFIGYAWCTWLYRFFLFLGIALLVYHFFFKLLGLLMMAVEVGWFILRPIWSELAVWRNLGFDAWIKPQSRITLLLLIVGIAVLVVPWQGHVLAPALIKAERYAEIYLPTAARLDTWQVKTGQAVKSGELLAQLSSRELDFQARNSALEGQLVEWQLAYQGLEQNLNQRRQVLLKELESAGAKQAGFRHQQTQLTIQAPFDGVALDLNQQAQVGQWLKEGEALLIVADPGSQLIEAYVAEEDLQAVGQADSAVFYPDQPGMSPISCRVERIDQGGAARVPAMLASMHGGAIAARFDAQQQAVPESAVYRIILRPEAESQNLPHFPGERRGSVRLDTPASGLLRRFVRQVTTVLVRESGF
ncbi:efflux RND transporter periplasmic adaptor subunit [Methylomonas albis]|uniref:HlyD family efflux transporter periplasmic adaptor subunit n=1 Tax=Methylomonas albis TaxID=1854563 RepID=A0ABR9CZP2_9GAMM|nr:efflux RND transporter periplasmic adaptor subunit [Methylomonas albis]MBD9356016.1 HlyD family efflux transporter periplasmic adaptor subunit [Methylomonas albis]